MRLSSGLEPRGVHRFADPASGEKVPSKQYWDPAEACVLHYAHGGPDAVATKLARLLHSTGVWWNIFPLYVEGRGADECRLAELYREVVAIADAQEGERQVSTGICFRYAATLPPRCSTYTPR